MQTNEIISENLKIVDNIKTKLYNNDQLNMQESFYFAILFKNNLIDIDGNLTDEGKTSLCQ